jgi:hypothetical protein
MRKLIAPEEDFETETNPYNEGATAFVEGKGRDDNPYDYIRQGLKHENWYSGWYNSFYQQMMDEMDLSEQEYYSSFDANYEDEVAFVDPFDFTPTDTVIRIKGRRVWTDL